MTWTGYHPRSRLRSRSSSTGPLVQNPHRGGKPLRFELAGKRSARRGNYRVIYEILETAVQVEAIAVQHRADGYRRDPA